MILTVFKYVGDRFSVADAYQKLISLFPNAIYA